MITDEGKNLLVLHDYAPRIETDYNIYINSENSFEWSYSPVNLNIDNFTAKSGNYEETQKLRTEFKEIMSNFKSRKLELDSKIESLKNELGDEYYTDAKADKLEQESHDIYMITKRNVRDPNQRLWQIIDLMKSEYGVSEI